MVNVSGASLTGGLGKTGAGCIFLNLRGPDSGASTFLFGGVGIMPLGPRCGSELRRASCAGAQNVIQDAGALRAPARTKVFLNFVKIVLEFGVLSFGHLLTISDDFRGKIFLFCVFLSCVGV